MKINKKKLIIVDFNPEKERSFLDAFKDKSDWALIKYDSSRLHKNVFSNLKRIVSYFLISFKLLSKRKDIDVIIAWQQFYGICFMFLFAFFHLKKNAPKIVVLNFIYKQKKGLIGKFYYKFIKKSLSYPALEKIVVLSTYEKKFYAKQFNIDIKKFSFIRIGFDIKKPVNSTKGDYFVSAGRSNRDYDFLVESFAKMPNEKLYIISDSYKAAITCNNVFIENNCFGDKYLDIVSKAKASIISLGEDPISSGQLFALDSMACRKPCIVTNNPGILDYITNNVNGIVINKNFEELKNAISKINNDNFYKNLSKNTYVSTLSKYGDQVFNLLLKGDINE